MTILKGKHDAPALIAPEGTLTYSELHAQIAMCTAAFEYSGVRFGTRVALYQPTSLRCVVTLLTLIEMGAVVCPISTRVPPAQIEAMAERVRAKAVYFVDRATPTFNSDLSPILFDAMASEVETASSWHDLEPDRVATIIHTSGSSGTPKPVVHTLENHLAAARASNQNIQLTRGDIWLLSLPLYHVGGFAILFRTMQAGAAVRIPKPEESLSKSLARPDLTHISLVSTQLYRLLQNDADTANLQRLKAVLMGGSAMPEELITRAIELGIPIHTSYGMTEMCSQITSTPPQADTETLKTSGLPLQPDSVRISDTGEIEVGGTARFQGYLDDRGELATPFTEDGFFPTGDHGRFDDHGRLIVTGRKDNQFISGGENIQPEQIEYALCQIPGILQAVVVPVPNPEYGHRPVAYIRSETEWTEDILRETLRATLPGFMIPDAIHPWPEDLIPEGMKVDRAAMTQRAAEGN